MKRIVYIAAFTFLGILLQFLVHAVVEIGVISLLLRDFPRYGLGLTWEDWFQIHRVGTVALLALGIWFGYAMGVYWWQVIYVEHRRRKWKRT